MMGLLFMQADDVQPLSFFKDPGSSAGEVLVLIGIFVGLALVIFLWAAYARRTRKMHHVYSHLHTDNHGGSSRRRKRSSASRLFGRKHRRRKSHEKERPINPTLAQTGGLPPRHEDQRPPS